MLATTLTQPSSEIARSGSAIISLDIREKLVTCDNNIIFSTGISAVPEPDTWAMFILGIGMLGVAVQRRKAGRSVEVK